ncbi:MarR family winged helix-turn-helix transcriptional regulator [Evansella cellulosilytica]|uniref:Regulatory protein MarR n=1 Tax=Evansella cellulosilytica (strain ATCC 21833 / DSM 2522 / FERM P-1141 / JCM 9156 / N-4) TaxID=649639 RepID=E6TUZ2_EVAC2|nr:MarR family transcriptional regulator [Evansella cellulosilytica]ADU28575.1 regulatory protein MarR [Evansella cellulosilytica DSM 2522]
MSRREMDQMFGYHIGVLSHLIQNQYNKNLSQFDLTISQAKVLYLLSHDGDKLQSELQKRLFIQASTMNGIIDSMLKRALIEKRDSQEDRRSKVISLTEKGISIERELWVNLDHMERELLAGFSIEEQQLLMMWLKRMKENMQEVDRDKTT